MTLLAALFFLMALNLFGLFEWGGFAQSMTSNLSAQGRYADAFLAGVLATVVATPCTAPFMGAAVGFTLAQPAAVSLAVFAMLGAGMALPVLVAFVLPRGAAQAPEARPVDGDLQAGDGLPALRHRGLARLGAGRAGGQRRGARAAGGAPRARHRRVDLRALGAVGKPRAPRLRRALRRGRPVARLAGRATPRPARRAPRSPKAGEIAWQAWSPEKLAELRAAGTPVFVDFTAAWCVTCQVNKRVALNREEVVKALADRGVVALKADWTNHDPRITAALAELGRNALPVYALYAPGQPQPKLLPEVLTASLVVAEISKLPAPKPAATANLDPR